MWDVGALFNVRLRCMKEVAVFTIRIWFLALEKEGGKAGGQPGCLSYLEQEQPPAKEKKRLSLRLAGEPTNRGPHELRGQLDL